MVIFGLLLSFLSVPAHAQPSITPPPITQISDLPRGGSLGISMAPVSPELRTKYKLKPGEGALIRKPLPGQTGDKAGVRAGDVLIAFNGNPVALPTLADNVKLVAVGQKVTLRVMRDGNSVELSAALTEKPKDPGNANFEVIYSDVVSNGKRMRTIYTKPKSPGKHPAVFFIQGFAPISYDYTLEGSEGEGPRLDAPILLDLANSGYVLLRMDKPGVGDSEGGPFADLDYTTELDIYRQALKQLKSLDYVDADNIFLFGHSMGGAFGPMVAAENPVKGLIMYGIAARTWHEYLLDTVRYQGLLAGGTYAAADDAVRKSAKAMEAVLQDKKTPDQVKKEHPELAATVDGLFPGGLLEGKVSSFWSQLEDTNFADYWTRVNAHVFAIHGASDFVSYEIDHKLVADIVNKVHPGWGKFATAPSSDHLFNNWPTEAESLKHWPTGTNNPAFTQMLKDWMQDVMTGKS